MATTVRSAREQSRRCVHAVERSDDESDITRLEVDGHPAGIRVVIVVDDEVASVVAVDDDAEPIAGGSGEVVADADAGQRSLEDLHPLSLARDRPSRTGRSIPRMATTSHLAPVWFKVTDLQVSHGKGSWIFTTDGHEYLDFTAGIAVTSTG